MDSISFLVYCLNNRTKKLTDITKKRTNKREGKQDQDELPKTVFFFLKKKKTKKRDRADYLNIF